MNPLIRKQLDQLNSGLGQLQELLDEARLATREERDKREKLLQQHWRESKEYVTLGHAAKDLATMREENQRLRTERIEIQQHLRRVLDLTRAISSEFRP